MKELLIMITIFHQVKIHHRLKVKNKEFSHKSILKNTISHSRKKIHSEFDRKETEYLFSKNFKIDHFNFD